MLRLIKRLAISLLAGAIALVAAFQIILRLGNLQLELFDPHADGQAGIGPFVLAVWLAPAVGLLTFALLFRRSRRWL